jgi:N-terminal acetyltransferase B complex non-catalytic subunit
MDGTRQRKLQPIYNALDGRNYKAAIKLCSKKDIERWDIVKVLKAHALERLGKADEALDLCREVKSRNPTDDSVLSTLVLTYKVRRIDGAAFKLFTTQLRKKPLRSTRMYLSQLTGQIDEAIECYETALKLQADNDENARELFALYCRRHAYMKAQQLSTKLYKQTQQPCYMFW